MTTLSAPAPSTTGRRPRGRRAAGGFRPDIQGLRAVAVLLVVLYHAGVPGFSGGYVGVDVFFAISGFVITASLLREHATSGRISIARFVARRIRRLGPASALVLVVTLVVLAVSGYPAARSDAVDAIAAALHLSNYRFAIESVDYLAADGLLSPFQHYWSLAVEEQFYILFPSVLAVALALGKRRGGRWTPRATAVVALGFVCSISLWFSATTTADQPALSYFSLHTRAWEFGLGALLAVLTSTTAATDATNRRIPPAVGAVLAWLGLGLVVTAGVTFDEATVFPGVAALVPVVGTVLLLSPTSLAPGSPAGLLRHRTATWIGDVSYSFYLWHWPLVVIPPVLLTGEVEAPWPMTLGFMVVALVLAWATTRLVEDRTKHVSLTPVRWFVVGIALSGVVVLVASLLMIRVATASAGVVAEPVTVSPADGPAWEAVLRNATTTTDLPSNLTPALDEALNDWPGGGMADRTCHLNYVDTMNGESCIFGDATSDRTVVLTGDSHAYQWLPALETAAASRGWRAVSWTKSLCPLADVEFYAEPLKRDYAECTRWREETLAEIVRMQPELVVLSQTDVYDVPGDREWGEATARSVRLLTEAGIPVLYLLDTPRTSIPVPSCLAANARDLQECAIARESLPVPERRSAVIETLPAGVTVLDPLPVLCTDRSCPPVVGNALVYRDDDHLSATFSRQLHPLFDDALRASR